MSETAAIHNLIPPGWAMPVDRLAVRELPDEAINLNVHGRHLAGPLDGFGQLWQKTYTIRLEGATATAAQVIRVWKERFSSFWPEGNYFYGAGRPIEAGDVAVLNLSGPARTAISTGVMVIYADPESFSFMTPEGHMFGGLITFGAHEEQGTTLARVQMLIRAGDPFYEIFFRLGFLPKIEDAFWRGALKNLAAHFGVEEQAVEQHNVLLDSGVQWHKAGNIWHNAAIRTTLHAPLRWIRRWGRR